MRKQLPPNPYINLRLSALGDALSARAGDLLEDRSVGRRDVAYLLIAAAAHARPQTSFPNSPARLVQSGEATPLAAFAGLLEKEQRAVRWFVFKQAVDAAGGAVAGSAFDAVSAQSVRSDADCLDALRALSDTPGLVRGSRAAGSEDTA